MLETLSDNEFRAKYSYDTATPVIKQYLDSKIQHQDCLLFFRLGDFYELFFDDAKIASQILGITLTARNKESQEVPMCGIPYHSLDAYLRKLIDAGYKIALCEQLESPQEAKQRGAKSVVKRDVTRIITASTIIDESLTNANVPNYLISLVPFFDKFDGNKISLCFLDIATDDFGVYDFLSDNLSDELEKISPKEIIVSQETINKRPLYECLKPYLKSCVVQADSYFAYNKCTYITTKFLNIMDIKSIGELSQTQVSAIGSVLEYINITQKANLPKLSLPKITNKNSVLLIDAPTRKNLELTKNVNGEYKDSLLELLNKTVTKSGNRLMFRYVSSPITDLEELSQRHDVVEYYVKNHQLLLRLQSALSSFGDIERIVAKISVKRAMPYDIIVLKDSINSAFEIKNILLSHFNDLPVKLQEITKLLPSNLTIPEVVKEVLQDNPAKVLTDGGFIRSDYHPRLQELSNILHNNDAILNSIKAQYQQKTGVDNLKILRNNVIGLFIEISSKNANKMTDDTFIHRQTMNNNIRYSTIELQKLDQDILTAQGQLVGLEQEIFSQLCDRILEYTELLKNTANAVSELDVFLSLAFVAKSCNFTKPIMVEDQSFEIIDGRHPIVENNFKRMHENFSSNSCSLSEKANIWLITGPNMGGKSTFLRQNALMIILSQIGSFVPASYAKIGIVDKLFSRIGASDDISKGRSTFMVEMTEVSSILAQSTYKSFIVLDEVGRGTSTYDGVAIAWASLEYINSNIKARSLFATHYHELNSLAEQFENIKNYNLAIQEINGSIRFLHKIVAGPSSKSYGIHVAEIAGMPIEVIKKAEEILDMLSNQKNVAIEPKASKVFVNIKEEGITNYQKQILTAIEGCNLSAMSPKEALDFLYRIKGDK